MFVRTLKITNTFNHTQKISHIQNANANRLSIKPFISMDLFTICYEIMLTVIVWVIVS